MAYSSETYRMLRNVRLLEEGELDGVRFVRCIPGRGEFGRDRSAAERLAIVQTAVREINEPGVGLASNPDFGGDYLRVATSTETFRLICQMLS